MNRENIDAKIEGAIKFMLLTKEPSGFIVAKDIANILCKYFDTEVNEYDIISFWNRNSYHIFGEPGCFSMMLKQAQERLC